MRVTLRALTGLALTAFALAPAGCAKDHTGQDVAAMNSSNIKRVSNIYAAYQNVRGFKGPADEAEFKNFIKNYDPEKLQWMGIDANNVDAVFISERDGKPFKVRYKVGGGRGSVDPVVFEQEGVAGKKQVGYTGGKVEEVDDATYQQLWAGKGPGREAPAGPYAGQGGGPPPAAMQGAGRPAGGAPPGAPTGPPK